MNRAARLRAWQRFTVGLMVLGYAGYYLCRSNLSVSMLAIAKELTARGLAPNVSEAKDRLGWAVSLGTVGYAVGKFAAGSLVDLLGGRRNYLIGMAGAVVCTMLFTLGGSVPIFTLVWFANRLIQSLGWPGMIKITSRWFSYARYGTVMGVISLSFLFGDALARYFMGFLISAGFGWRSVFWIAAGVLGALLVLNFALIRESPKELDLPEPETNPANLFGKLGEDPHPEAAGPLWATLARSPAFWIVCLISLGVTLLRETFNNWTPTYLVEGLGLSPGTAAKMSSLFPLFGGVSVIVAGMLGDRFGRGVRAAIILGGMMLCGLVLALLGSADFAGRDVGRSLPGLNRGFFADRALFLPGRRDLARFRRQARRRDGLRDHRWRRLSFWRRDRRQGRRQSVGDAGLAGCLQSAGRRGLADERGGGVFLGRPGATGLEDGRLSAQGRADAELE